MSKLSIRLLTLQTFSTTGGIQKMARTLGYSLQQLANAHQWSFQLWSLHDPPSALLSQYIPESSFKGFKNARIKFVLENFISCRQTSVLILSHINLLSVGVLVKFINPQCRVYLIAHGIEVWRPLSFMQKLLLKKCDLILCVSRFTQQQVHTLHRIPLSKLRVLNNALDPFIQFPATFTKPSYLLERYGLNEQQPVIFTLTRLASTEQYKGYEQVIKAVAKLRVAYPHLKYVLAGQYDATEEARIQQLIAHHEVQNHIIVTGFIEDKEITDHFLLADLFVLPSKKEGFGLVFIEALACGLPVISGNADGSADAVKNGELGESINADSEAELEQAIVRCLSSPLSIEKRKLLQSKCIAYFNEAQYRNELEYILNNNVHEPATA
jgi:phosphatidylinositol alpha-1,6-mannosyltransferase